MSNTTHLTPIMVERAAEQLRQERETFDQQKKQEHLWFKLRLIMGFASIVLLGAVMIISVYILFNNGDFPKDVVTAAGAALFIDVLGLLISVWKMVVNPQSSTKLQPTSSSSIPTVRTE